MTHLDVEDVPNPLITWGEIHISELFVILLGSVLNIPWITELVKKKRKAKQTTISFRQNSNVLPIRRKSRRRQ